MKIREFTKQTLMVFLDRLRFALPNKLPELPIPIDEKQKETISNKLKNIRNKNQYENN